MCNENFIEPQAIDDIDMFISDDKENSCLKEEPHTDGFGSLQEHVIKRSVSAKDIIKLILSFLLVVVCALVTAWMVYNLVTTGSAFPTDFIMSSSSNLIPKSVKGFKL